uniref:G-protein coupled receptors family 1 profile domain-containing protein n=1 Tax=Heliothis virescens TaxID=7102 RepID=A0A2A4K705_HELVI
MSERAHSAEPLLPPLALAAYVACVAGAAALANCSVLAALIKTSRSGLLTIILQLAIADFILGASIGPELWSYNSRSWDFGSHGCVAYRGLNVFASTAATYLVATIALHSLATINIEEKAIAKRMKRNEDEDEEIRCSRHSLVTSSDSSTPPRTMNLDYRLSDRRISVTQPSVFVWVLAISLSVPEFVLASTVHLEKDAVLCTIVDTSQRLHMYSMLAMFNLFLPLIIMSTVAVLVIIKLKNEKILSRIEYFESIAALKLSLWLIVIYMVLCSPRSIVTAYNIYSKSLQGNETSLAHTADMTSVNVAASSTYILVTLFRPLLSIMLLPRVRKSFSFGSYTSTDNV